MKGKWKEMKEKWGSLVLGACVVILFYLLVSNIGVVWDALRGISKAITPIIVGAVTAYIMNPFAKFYDRTIFKKMKNRKVSWYLSVVLAIIVLLVILALILYTLIPEMINSITNFANNIEGYLSSLNKTIDGLNLPNTELIDSLKDLISNEGNLISRGVQLLVSNIPVIIQRSSSFTSGTVNVLIGMILAVYFIADKHTVKSWIKRAVWLIAKDSHYDNVANVGRRFNSIFAKYITCELIDAAIVGVVNYIFMTIFGMPYTIMVSVVVGVSNLVPTFGPIVGGVIGALVLLLANPINALWFIIFTIVLQTLDGYFLKPRLFGDVLNVPGVLIIISIIVFGRLFGILGIFMSIPLAAIIVYILTEFVVPRMESRKAQRTADEKPKILTSVDDGIEGRKKGI